MNDKQASHPEDTGTHPERRKYPHLRTIYDEARQLIAHLFNRQREPTARPMEHIAHRIIQQRYPNLSDHDIRILVGAIERVNQVFDNTSKKHWLRPRRKKPGT